MGQRRRCCSHSYSTVLMNHIQHLWVVLTDRHNFVVWEWSLLTAPQGDISSSQRRPAAYVKSSFYDGTAPFFNVHAGRNIEATVAYNWQPSPKPHPHHTNTTLFEKSCGVNPHHNFFHKVWCECGVGVVSVWFGRRLSVVCHRKKLVSSTPVSSRQTRNKRIQRDVISMATISRNVYKGEWDSSDACGETLSQ